MKFGCCGSLSLALLLLALLETITLVRSQEPERCQILRATCAGKGALKKVATGKESSTVRCSIDTDQPGETGTLEWYFTRTIVESATLVNTSNTEKYILQGTFSQQLIVNNVSVEDDGYYFCRSQNNDILSGTCLEAQAPAVFQTCLEGAHIPQQGCPGMKPLNRTVGESVTFDIALGYSGRNKTCNIQEIQMISLSKVGNSIALVNCSRTSCASTEERLTVLRGPTNEFNINVTLNNLISEDSGSYTAAANIGIPGTSMVCRMHKNFTLIVFDNTGPNSISSGEQTIIILTSVLLFVIAVIITV